MVGQAALDRAAEAFSALVEARRRIVETHESLDHARAQMGLREVDAGDTEQKIPPGIFEGADVVRIRSAA